MQGRGARRRQGLKRKENINFQKIKLILNSIFYRIYDIYFHLNTYLQRNYFLNHGHKLHFTDQMNKF